MECPYYNGDLKPGRTTYTADRDGYHMLFYDIPAWICEQCGEPVFEEKVIEAVQRLLKKADERV
jgi:YgiT-type zinc finger domain-containing protein